MSWLEGDNYQDSEDSRTAFGPIPLALFKSKAVWVCWPLSRWGPVETKWPRGRVLAMAAPSASHGKESSWWDRVLDKE